MNKKKVFIAGRLPKHPTEVSKQRFLDVAKQIGTGVKAVFPTVYSEPLASWDDSIRSDVAKLMNCSDLHMLSNWQGHKRSEILRDTALRVGIHVHYH